MNFWQSVSELIRNADVIIEVIDSRMPEIATNKDVEKLVEKNKKQLIKVFNKTDLLSEGALKRLKKEYKGFFVSVKDNQGVSELRNKLKMISKKKKDEDLKVGFVGYPNAGKSSLINILTRRGKTKVSRKAGTTRGIQWINFSNIKIIDSPGVISNNEWNESRLAIINAKNANKLKNPEKVALGIIDMFLNKDPRGLEERYNIEVKGKTLWEIMDSIGQSKKIFKKGGELDENRIYFLIINDWQKGRLKL